MNSHIKLCYLITGLNVGGAEMQLYQVAKNIKKKGSFDPIVISMIEPGPVGEMLIKEGIPVFSLNMIRGKPSLSAIESLRRLIKKEQVKILHTHMFHANLLGRMMKFFHPSIKIVSTIHNINIGSRKREMVLKYTEFLSDRTTIISKIARNYFLNRGFKESLQWVPNGINSNIFKPDFSIRNRKRNELGIHDQFVWLAVGRIEKAKNYPFLLKTIKKVLEIKNDILYLIVGSGPLLDEMKNLSTKLCIEKKVRFLGLRQDVHELMNAADGFVMSSSWEGMPLVLLEAGASGLPALATDVGGNREVVIDGKTGYLVKLNDIDDFKDKMISFMSLPREDRLKMGETARNFIVEKFSLEKVVATWEKIYFELLCR